jgi:hypothetical protein
MDYNNPIGQPNPFFTTPPIVLVVRHVRLTAANELVAEDAQALPRHLMRADYHRVQPLPIVNAPVQRNYPEHGIKKKAY